MKHNGNDCHYDGRKGKSGRKRKISDQQLAEVEEGLEEGRFVDGKDVRKEMFPDVSARTVRRSLLMTCTH